MWATLSKKAYLLLLGVLISLVLFVLSAMRYPDGYDWTHHFISTLFQPITLNGAENSARQLAVLAMFTLCLSLGTLFQSLSRRGKSRFHKTTIEVAGIGSMVYGFLAVTPLHDLCVAISLLCFVTAMVTILHLLYVERHSGLLATGIVCLIMLLSGAVMYYGNVLFGLLPVVQKLTFVTCASWLFVLEFKGPAGDERISSAFAQELS